MQTFNKTIMVTGGSGFIGSNFVSIYMKNHPKTRVVNVDNNMSAPQSDFLDSFFENENFVSVCSNICNTKAMTNILKHYKITEIVNFAAETHVDNSFANSDKFFQTNVNGVLSICNAMVEVKEKLNIKLLQISTDEVYGHTSKACKENANFNPGNPYAASKSAGEMVCLAYMNTHNLDIVRTRSTNNYGAHQKTDKFVPKVIHNAILGEKIPIYGQGLQQRNWLYVEDHCDALELVLENGKRGEVYNIKGNKIITNLALAKLILKKMKADESLIEFVEDRKGHDFSYLINDTKIKTTFDFKPETPFNMGICATIEHYNSILYKEERL